MRWKWILRRHAALALFDLGAFIAMLGAKWHSLDRGRLEFMRQEQVNGRRALKAAFDPVLRRK
jgi:hypothetical protein